MPVLTALRSFSDTVRVALVSPWQIALAGLVSLSVAMGIGRFAFTPVLPMMLRDGTITLAAASQLASINYLGYVVGALLCTFQPWVWRWMANPPTPAFAFLVRAGLLSTGVLTLAMALPTASLWFWLRFFSGLVSAVVFVYTSGWCMARLAALGKPSWGGIMYAGPGAGIVMSGLMTSAMVAGSWRATSAWLVLGLLAFALTALVWRVIQGEGQRLAALATVPNAVSDGASLETQRNSSRFEMPLLATAYGLAGFGYIITATFLPVIARTALPASVWLDLFWPLFGVGVMAGALLATRVPLRLDMRWLLAACYLVQALGIGISLLSPSPAGFAIGSALLGLPFTAITFFGVQELRRLRPQHTASYIGLLSATYGIGQILGPQLVHALLARSANVAAGFTLSLEIAVGSLLLGAAMYVLLVRFYPMPKTNS